MRRRALLVFLVFLLSFSVSLNALGVEKLKIGSAVKEFAGYYLPMHTAEEKGFWKENGLEVEWVPMRNSPTLHKAIAGGSINVGWTVITSALEGIAAGVPMVVVADLYPKPIFTMWVRTGSPVKDVKELKGGKIGVLALGTIAHAYARVIMKGVGLEKDVRYIGTGGPTETIAGLKAGVVDAIVLTHFAIIGLEYAGEVRAIARAADYLPKEWMDHIVVARNDFVKSNPETVRRSIKGMVQAIDFMKKEPRWVIEKAKSFSGYPEPVGKQMYEIWGFTKDGKIDRKALDNIRNFVIEYGLAPKEKLPPAEQLFTAELTS